MGDAGCNQLRSWLLEADYEAIDDVLLALAELAAPDGGNDIAAAGVLAKCLLPGACQLAGWLSRRQQHQPFRDNQPAQGAGYARINELVASQLWIEVRTVGWHPAPREWERHQAQLGEISSEFNEPFVPKPRSTTVSGMSRTPSPLLTGRLAAEEDTSM